MIGTIQLSSEKDYSKLKHAHLTSNDEQSKNTKSSVDYISVNNDDKETKENDNVNSEVNLNRIQSEKKEHEEDSNGTPKLKCIKNQTPHLKKRRKRSLWTPVHSRRKLGCKKKTTYLNNWTEGTNF